MVETAPGSWADPVVSAVVRDGSASGPLRGLTFVAKDLFDVRGEVTGAGNPDWAAQADVAGDDADAVAALLAAGARLVGKSMTDELAYSLSGTNVHFGTPANPAAPGRVPGGSSSGSASAVAAGRCDLALGTDTGGSIRVPASYCGLWGMRPTHGRVSVRGLVPLAPSFDTVGWFARRADHLAAAGAVLLEGRPLASVRRIVVVDELMDLADASCRESLQAAAADVARRNDLPLDRTDRSTALQGWRDPSPDHGWLATFRTIQGAEAWAQHGGWIQGGPKMGPGIHARFLAGSEIDVGELAAAVAKREDVRRAMLEATADGSILAVPSASGPAPRPDVETDAKNDLRLRTLMLTSAAGLAGLPALSMPLASGDGLPVGLCLVGPPGADEALLAMAAAADG